MKNKSVSDFRRYSSTIFVMILSIVCAVVSGLLLFVPEIQTTLLCKALSGVLIVWGLAQIARFFFVGAYHRLHDFSFSAGALLVILGGVALVRVEDMASHLEIVLQLAILCIGVVLVQNTIQLICTNSPLWTVEGILAVAVLTCAVLSLMEPEFLVPYLVPFTHWSLFAAGIICTWTLPVVAFNVYRKNKRDIAQAAALELEHGKTPAASDLPLASFGDTDELDVEAIRAKAEENS